MQYGDREVRCKGTHTSRDSSLILVGNSRKESDTDTEAVGGSSGRDALSASGVDTSCWCRSNKPDEFSHRTLVQLNIIRTGSAI